MLLDLLEETLPEWMLAPGRQHWANLMAAVAATFDGLVEGAYQARLGTMPGQVDADIAPAMGGFLALDALALVGRDRRRRRGLSESAPAFAERCRRWLVDWPGAGTPWGLLQELAGVLGPDPGILRIVTAGGDWWTLDTDGTITWQRGSDGFTYDPATGDLTTPVGIAHAWDWDSLSQPPPYDQGDAGRCWLIAYVPLNSPWAIATDGAFQDPGIMGDRWDAPTTLAAGPTSPDAGVIGLATPSKWVDLLRHTIADWKAAGLPFAYAILSLDPAAFNPTSDSTPTSVPDGQWAWHGKLSGTTRIAARFPSARYIAAPSGGQRK